MVIYAIEFTQVKSTEYAKVVKKSVSEQEDIVITEERLSDELMNLKVKFDTL